MLCCLDRLLPAGFGQEQTFARQSECRSQKDTLAMSPTEQRDQATSLAKDDPREALMLARHVSDPWFRAQALSWVARFTDADPVAIAEEAAKAAVAGRDNYQQTAVRAWEIAALAERQCAAEAKRRLFSVLETADNIEPVSSRSEALLLLLQAAAKISADDAAKVYEVIQATCQPDEHWRCKRALQDAAKMIAGERQCRNFFW
jgi:hypothetical protein